jgi:hypothetical protein
MTIAPKLNIVELSVFTDNPGDRSWEKLFGLLGFYF